MKIDLTDTTAGKINKALVRGRREIGTPAVGMVLTLVIVTDEENAYDALKAAGDASSEHPSRTLVVIRRVSRSSRDRTQSRIDAEILLGADAGTGETVVLRLHGEVSDHAQSVVLPLLLPDAPVVAWWPVDAPVDPANDPLGALAQRRVTDSFAAEQPVRELTARAKSYAPGDTDLAWTRITPWRSMLAAALDQVICEVTSVEVEGEEFNPSCELLAMWLADRLDVPVRRTLSAGPGLTAVRMSTSVGPIALARPDGTVATLAIHGQPDRPVALKRRDTVDLIAEELRRLDPDDTYASALRFGVERLNSSVSTAFPAPAVTRRAVAAIPAPVSSEPVAVVKDAGAGAGAGAGGTGAGASGAGAAGAGSSAAGAGASGVGSSAAGAAGAGAAGAGSSASGTAAPVEGARKSAADDKAAGASGGASGVGGGVGGTAPAAAPAAAQAPVLPAEAPEPVRKAITP